MTTPPATREQLSRTTSGEVVPAPAERDEPRRRALSGTRERIIGGAAPLAIALLAFVMRLQRLGQPHEFAFDETYYAKDAWSLLHFGYTRDYQDKANEAIIAGTTTGPTVWKDTPEMLVHPEVGKWLIALGEKAFGMDPFGWRIAAVVVGSLMVLLLARFVRRLTGSTLLGCIAALLLCFDGMHFVLSRLALLDIFVAFFLLAAVHCLVADRDWTRRRFARLVEVRDAEVPGFGPVRSMLVRPWLLAAGVCFGLAVGTKWTALYPLAAFGLLVWAWCAGMRRMHGVRGAWWRSALADGVPAFVQLVVVAALVYVATWTGWLMNADQYEEHLSATQYTQYSGSTGCKTHSDNTDAKWPTATEKDAAGLGEVSQSLRSLWYYHRDVLTFHQHFLDCSEHSYGSKPLAWPLLNKPVGVNADLDIKPGDQGCRAAPGSDCLRQVLLIGTPVLWWGGALALLFAALWWVARRDWRFGLVTVGALSTWLPWLQYDDRPIFIFYAITMLPFTITAIALTIALALRARRPVARTAAVVVAGSFVILTVLNFAWFWPIFTNQLLTNAEWHQRIWFERWI